MYVCILGVEELGEKTKQKSVKKEKLYLSATNNACTKSIFATVPRIYI